MVLKQWKVGKTPETSKQIERTKKWLGEKTDSKTIAWLVNYAYGKLFGKD